MKHGRKKLFAPVSLGLSITTLFFPFRLDAQNQNARPGIVSNDVVSHSAVNNARPHEWTMEEMLLAEPMPMSGEEREFSHHNKGLQSLRDWSLADFKKYVGTDIGKSHAIATATRWMADRRMLRTQIGVSRAFLSGKPPARSGKNSATGVSPPSRSQAPPAPAPDSSGGNPPSAGSPGEAPGCSSSSSPGMGSENPFEPKRLARFKNLTIPGVAAGDFVIDDAAFSPVCVESTFNDLKACRQDISNLCRQFEEIKTEAKSRRVDRQLDWLLSSYEYR